MSTLPGTMPKVAGYDVYGTFKPADQLRALYEARGITADRDVIAYCRIGERSSIAWFALKYLLGYPRVKNYDGSWTEYGSLVGAPIEHVPVHPTQLYDMLLALSWYGILRAIDRRYERLRPYLFFFFLALYAVSRFCTGLAKWRRQKIMITRPTHINATIFPPNSRTHASRSPT